LKSGARIAQEPDGSVSVPTPREVAAELVRETREAQDLPPELTDDAVFEFVAFLMRTTSSVPTDLTGR
jgi:hypothetical protein